MLLMMILFLEGINYNMNPKINMILSTQIEPLLVFFYMYTWILIQPSYAIQD